LSEGGKRREGDGSEHAMDGEEDVRHVSQEVGSRVVQGQRETREEEAVQGGGSDGKRGGGEGGTLGIWEGGHRRTGEPEDVKAKRPSAVNMGRMAR
jgi:hypothetical protein